MKGNVFDRRSEDFFEHVVRIFHKSGAVVEEIFGPGLFQQVGPEFFAFDLAEERYL